VKIPTTASLVTPKNAPQVVVPDHQVSCCDQLAQVGWPLGLRLLSDPFLLTLTAFVSPMAAYG
jgi:hypothetical protein